MSAISIATSLYTIKKVRYKDDIFSIKVKKNQQPIYRLCVIVCFFDTMSFLFQQYVMLHDMVAAHSVVRVSVCRGNKGMFHFNRVIVFYSVL